MKNKKWLIPIGIVCLIIIIFIIIINVVISKGIGISVGRYLEAKNNTVMLIKKQSPIQMTNRTEKGLYNNLDVGDKILVIHSGIEESYPARTGVYAVLKIGEGTIDDISEKVVDELTKLGWLDVTE